MVNIFWGVRVHEEFINAEIRVTTKLSRQLNLLIFKLLGMAEKLVKQDKNYYRLLRALVN